MVVCFFASFIFRAVAQKIFEKKINNERFLQMAFMDKDETFFTKIKNRMRKKKAIMVENIDWTRLYPFVTDEKNEPGVRNQAQKKSKILQLRDNIYEKKGDMKDKLDKHIEHYLMAYDQIVDLSRKYEEFIGRNLEHVPTKGVYKLADGYLTFCYGKSDVRDKAGRVQALNDYCKGVDAKFVYICAPSKVCERDVDFYGVKDFSNQNADEFLRVLEDSGLSYIDLRECIKKQGVDNRSLFFKTDHHWRPESALWAAREVGMFLNEKFDLDIVVDNFLEEKFRKDNYDRWFLGSQGKRVKLSLAEPDDISFYYTKDCVSLHLQIPSRKLDDIGDLSIWYDMTEIEPLDYYGSNPYAAFGYSNQPIIRGHNNGRVPDKKLLLLKDSFGNVFAPFLGLGVRDITVVDLRYFYGSLETLISKERPDVVLVLYNPGMLSERVDSSYNNIWNFR